MPKVWMLISCSFVAKYEIEYESLPDITLSIPYMV